MIEDMEAIGRFQKSLDEKAIPYTGVAFESGGIRIDFKDDATVDQRKEAAALAASFDRRPRKRNLAALKAWYDGLTAAQKTKLQAAMAVKFALDFPVMVEALGLSLPFEVET